MTDYVLASTGTDRGSGYHAEWLRCPRKAALNHIDKAQRTSTKPEWERNEEHNGKPHRLVVGSLFHLFLRAFYAGTPIMREDRIVWEDPNPQPESPLRLVQDTHPASYKEAQRLYMEYKLVASPEDLGVPSGFEVQLRSRLEGDGSYREVSGALDRRVDIAPEHAEGFLKRYGLELAPGRYIVDDKTESRNSGDFEVHFDMSLQFKYYMFLDELDQNSPCMGTLVNVFVKKKSPERHVLAVKALTDDDRRMVLNMIEQTPTQAELDKLVSGEVAPEAYKANPSACEFMGELCWHYKTKKCKRY